MEGFLITMEGPDGAGKTTQLDLLCNWFRQTGREVVRTREPGGTPIADKVRALLLDPAHGEMTARAEALLYMAARAQHTSELIGPALKRGAVVISDRFSDSTLVYQGVARGLKIADLIWLNRFATNALSPDLTLLLDGDVEKLSARISSRGIQDRLERESLEFHRKVRQGFLELAKEAPERIKVIDADRPVGAVWSSIEVCVQNFLMKRG